MENQRQLVWSHEITIDGVKFVEEKEFKDLKDNNYWLVHTRVIGDSRYSIQHVVNKESGEVKGENVDTNMKESQLAEFKKNWMEKWHPELPTLQVEQMEPFLQEFMKNLFEKSQLDIQNWIKSRMHLFMSTFACLLNAIEVDEKEKEVHCIKKLCKFYFQLCY